MDSQNKTEQSAWFVGIDWATQEHQVCVLDAQGQVVGERAFAHDGTGLAALCEWLLGFGQGRPDCLHVAIEIPHGPVVETLIEREIAVYAINPKQLDRFRDRFTVAGAKDDRRDAFVLAHSLLTDRDRFRRLQLDAPLVIELREWSRVASDVQQARTRLGNRLREQLRRYFPQMLALSDDVAAPWFLDLWELVQTPQRAARMRSSSIAKLLKKHRIRRATADEVLERLREPPVRVAPGTVTAACAHIKILSDQLRLLNTQLKQAHRRLDDLCAELADSDDNSTEQRDVTVLRSLPGVGRVVLATLLAEASQPLVERDYHALRALAGVAPVTKRSGKKRIVVMRQACSHRIRTAVYHWSRVAVQHDPLSKKRYAALRQRGHSHGRALRSVGDRLLAVACAMLKAGSTFDPAFAAAN